MALPEAEAKCFTLLILVSRWPHTAVGPLVCSGTPCPGDIQPSLARRISPFSLPKRPAPPPQSSSQAPTTARPPPTDTLEPVPNMTVRTGNILLPRRRILASTPGWRACHQRHSSGISNEEEGNRIDLARRRAASLLPRYRPCPAHRAMSSPSRTLTTNDHPRHGRTPAGLRSKALKPDLFREALGMIRMIAVASTRSVTTTTWTSSASTTPPGTVANATAGHYCSLTPHAQAPHQPPLEGDAQ